MRHFYTFLVAILFTSFGFGQTIYDADFSNDGDGFPAHTTSSPPAAGPASAGPFGLAPNAWTLSYVNTPATDGTSNTFEVVGGELQSDDWGGQGIFTSQAIDVSGTSTVDISATGVNSGANDGDFTYFYILDGGTRVETSIGVTSNGNPVNYSIVGLDVSGASTLEVGFEFSENGSGNGYDISQFTVTSVGGGSNPTIGFDSATSTENETNTTFTSSNIPITVSNYDGNQIDIDVNVTGGTAEAGDYSFTSPTSLSFTADGTQNITIDINDDADFDDETVELTITETSSVTGLVISQATHTVTIIDDEVAPPVTTVAFQSFEGADSWNYTTNPATFEEPGAVWSVVDNTFNSFGTIPSDGINFFGIQDLESTNGTSGFGSIDFKTLYVAGLSNVVVRFDYEVDGFDSDDDMKYELFEDNISQGEVVFVDGFSNLNADGTIEINVTPGTTSIRLVVSVRQNGGSDYGALDNFRVEGLYSGLTYANATWTPSAPDGTTGSSDALIVNGEYTVSGTTELNDVLVNPAASVIVPTSTTLNANTITLESDSRGFANLISNGSINSSIAYNRFVSEVGTGATGTGGNDLISLPLFPSGGLTFDTFLTLGSPTNATKLASQTTIATTYAFGPYNNETPVPDYENYDSNSTDALVVAKGYRVATTTGETLTFTGDALQANQTIMLTNPVAGGSQWNLIGNPFASYVDAQAWLSTNGSILDPTAIAIYGYNSGTYSGSDQTTGNFTIINGTSNNTLNIAPGQAFFVAADTGDLSGNAGTVVFAGNSGFPADMRTTTGDDDFIEGRNSTNHHLKLKLNGTTSETTSFYFNDNSTRGLDPGFDAATLDAFTSEHLLYSHLVEDNTGRSMAINSLSLEDMLDVTIPLGVNANQGEEITFSIDTSTLPNGIDVYLDDNVANTSTLLNSNDYTVTPSVDLNGTGRFYLRLGDSALSAPTAIFDQIDIFTNRTEKTVVISGELPESSVAHIYDLQGRQVLSTDLDTALRTQRINISDLSTGIYVVKVSNNTASKSQKVILN
ncbi:T9SS type A sorting domain-containing protein [Winogradskyella ouciana]|uniref:T9SS type A sorting domain-containing protein n=1 Tax=Winogradskyella ouciana TaxID=2608631 RepID=A0A7K1GBM5_9FLAO|nr:T9SS type A sorting domain-containing protein [Winogradskyella ouciana]MTE26531.1 T9SS type A sorting domain-containing protein [Winogradskyella ouciana]